MKISQMLKREDFYSINQKTLDTYYAAEHGDATLYIYPKLNAIITKRPTRKVKEYLFCEYSMNTGSLKAKLVHSYVSACLNMAGLLAEKTVNVSADVSDDTLIYPCNKKYRVFDFSANTVDVVIKDQFSDNDLKHEIAFRSQKNLPDFVPPLVKTLDNGYREEIIDGRPLARIYDGTEMYCQEAYKLICEYRKEHTRQITGKEYASYLHEKSMMQMTPKVVNQDGFKHLTELLTSQVEALDEVTLTFSHGDLQAGNIWIENGTDHIYIIDWESWGERSIWYDKAVLFDHLRPGTIENYLSNRKKDDETYTVLFEDLQFQLAELNSLPMDFGTEQFEQYVCEILKWLD